MMKVKVFEFVLILICAFGVSCADGSDGTTKACEPAEEVACTCENGDGLGVSTCSSKGTTWGPCLCGATPETDAVGQVDGGNGDSSCTPTDGNFKRDCYEGAVFWFDDCGNKGELIEACKLPEEACEEGLCVVGCAPMDHKACEGNALWWYDSCNNKGQLIEACSENTICSGDKCVLSCTPHAEKYCLNDAIYWYDSCGNAETPAEICTKDEFCKGCTVDDENCNQTPNCVKAFYDGEWLLTAEPNKKDACGLGNAEYFDQVLVLTIDGTDAVGKIQVAGFDVDFTGTLEGKHLMLEGSYTQQDGTFHEELIDANFTSLTTLEGIHTDNFSILAFPCSLYWDISGVKK
jgi:hypothetical protein